MDKNKNYKVIGACVVSLIAVLVVGFFIYKKTQKAKVEEEVDEDVVEGMANDGNGSGSIFASTTFWGIGCAMCALMCILMTLISLGLGAKLASG